MPLRQSVVLALFLSAVPAFAAPPPGFMAAPKLPDVTVVTESGQRVAFHQLIDDRTVVINFIFTTCPTVCPLMGASFAKVRSRLGNHDVQLISVSIDPETDTPARLTAWRSRFGPAGGWTLVTGAKPDIDQLLEAFGVFSATAASHSPSAFVADTRRGIWRKVDGLAAPSKYLAVIDSVRTEASR
jgi:protein SCO1/2